MQKKPLLYQKCALHAHFIVHVRTEELASTERLIWKAFVSRFLGFRLKWTGTPAGSKRTYMKLKLIASSNTQKNQ